jgi:hypothetical protein
VLGTMLLSILSGHKRYAVDCHEKRNGEGMKLSE